MTAYGSIQVLRGLAAVLVVIFHAFQWLDDQFWIGAAGVDVFFVISGFIIWRVAAREAQSPASFLWRRFTRVAPAYWVATGVVAAAVLVDPLFLPQVAVTPAHLFLSLAFIQHRDPHGLIFPLLPPGWSLNYEALFYGIVGLALFAPPRRRLAVVTAALFAVVAFGFAVPPAYGFIANPMLLQFAIGAWLGRQESLGLRLEPKAGLGFAISGALILAALWVAGFRNEFFRPLLWGAPAAMIVAGFVALEGHPRFKPPAFLIRLGDASYAIYLCHLPATALIAHGFGVWPAGLFVPLAAAASIATGLAFHAAIEQPLIRAARALPRVSSHSLRHDLTQT
jgi:exopolysaccharide production protein ExoZ